MNVGADTRNPCRRASKMWPSSWMKIIATNPKANVQLWNQSEYAATEKKKPKNLTKTNPNSRPRRRRRSRRRRAARGSSACRTAGGPARSRGARSSAASPEPFLAADVELLLPERDRLLERVDGLAAGVEGGGAVRRRDRDHDAGLADLDAADAVVDRHLRETVLRGQVGGQRLEHRLGHLLERLVLEIEHVTVARAVPNGADER